MRRVRIWLAFLLVLPFAALLWPPFYNRAAPALFGIPFFYWYQLLWIPLGALALLLASLAVRRPDSEPP